MIGTRPLDRLRVRPGVGAYGPGGTEADLRAWLTGAGMAKVALDVRGVFAYFEAQSRPDTVEAQLVHHGYLLDHRRFTEINPWPPTSMTCGSVPGYVL